MCLGLPGKLISETAKDSNSKLWLILSYRILFIYANHCRCKQDSWALIWGWKQVYYLKTLITFSRWKFQDLVYVKKSFPFFKSGSNSFRVQDIHWKKWILDFWLIQFSRFCILILYIIGNNLTNESFEFFLLSFTLLLL